MYQEIVKLYQWCKENLIDCTLEPLWGGYQIRFFDGSDVVAIVATLIPTIKELILSYFPKKTVTIKISNEYGSAELSAKTLEELDEMVEQYLAIIEKVKKAQQS